MILIDAPTELALDGELLKELFHAADEPILVSLVLVSVAYRDEVLVELQQLL